MEVAPKIPKESQKQEVVVPKGKDVTLKVPYTAHPVPTVIWYHKNQVVDTENNKKVSLLHKKSQFCILVMI